MTVSEKDLYISILPLANTCSALPRETPGHRELAIRRAELSPIRTSSIDFTGESAQRESGLRKSGGCHSIASDSAETGPANTTQAATNTFDMCPYSET